LANSDNVTAHEHQTTPVAVLGYQLYQDRKEPKGIQLNIGPSGVSIEKK